MLFPVWPVVVRVVAAIMLRAVARSFPEILTPARYVVGAIAVIVILPAPLRPVRGIA